jgi:hypothetical protein
MATDQHEAEGYGQPWGAGARPSSPDTISVGESSTEAIPRVWAERMLGSIRANRPGVWKAELFKASTGG